MKVLVTGTAGFIGYHVLERLAKDGVEAIGKLSIGQIIDMLEMRAKSVFAMISGIFMKRIRSQGYEDLFDVENFDNKRIASIINDYNRKYQSDLPDFLAFHLQYCFPIRHVLS